MPPGRTYITMDIYETPYDEYGPEWHATLPDDVRKPVFPHNPAHAPRSGLALRVARESLGISAAHLAEYLGVGKRTAERWEKLDEIPGWVETALRKITFATQVWESDLQDAGQVMIHTGGYRMLDGRPLPESWWIHLVGQAMRTNATIIPIAD